MIRKYLLTMMADAVTMMMIKILILTKIMMIAILIMMPTTTIMTMMGSHSITKLMFGDQVIIILSVQEVVNHFIW